MLLYTLASGGFEGFSQKKTTRLHMVLHTQNSGAESGRELFTGSKDLASLLVCTRKKFLLGVCGFFVSDIRSGGLLGHLGPLHLALGSNR